MRRVDHELAPRAEDGALHNCTTFPRLPRGERVGVVDAADQEHLRDIVRHATRVGSRLAERAVVARVEELRDG